MAKKSNNYNKIIVLSVAVLALMTPFFVNFITNNQQTMENYAAPPKNTNSTIILNPTQTPIALGSYISFSTTYPKTIKNPRVWLSCYQNNVMVYGEGGGPTTVFKLGGDSSQWLENGGGSASCFVEFYEILGPNGKEWNGQGAQTGKVNLANTSFEAVDK
jgi:hypothetical protein